MLFSTSTANHDSCVQCLKFACEWATFNKIFTKYYISNTSQIQQTRARVYNTQSASDSESHSTRHRQYNITE